MTIRLRVGHLSPRKELDPPLWSHLWLNWSGAYRILECSLSLQSVYCLNFSVLIKSWWFLIDDRPNRPGVHFLLSIFVAGCFPGDSGSAEPICQFRTHKRLGIKVWSLGQEDHPGGQGNPLQYSRLQNPMDRESWWATVHGVTQQLSTHVYLQLNYDSRLRQVGRSKMGVERGWFGKGSGFWKLCHVVLFYSSFSSFGFMIAYWWWQDNTDWIC